MNHDRKIELSVLCVEVSEPRKTGLKKPNVAEYNATIAEIVATAFHPSRH